MRHLKLFESFDDSDQNYHFPNEFIIDGVDEVFREYPELEDMYHTSYMDIIENEKIQAKCAEIGYRVIELPTS